MRYALKLIGYGIELKLADNLQSAVRRSHVNLLMCKSWDNANVSALVAHRQVWRKRSKKYLA
jgi:hypothetical protein